MAVITRCGYHQSTASLRFRDRLLQDGRNLRTLLDKGQRNYVGAIGRCTFYAGSDVTGAALGPIHDPHIKYVSVPIQTSCRY